MKIRFEKPIQWKWVCLFLTALVVLLTIALIADNLYNWRDFRYEQLQSDYQMLYQQTNNLAKNLGAVNNLSGISLELTKQINQILQVNNFPQYMKVISDTTQITGEKP